MEAVWKLEDKWKLSTQEAALLFVCTAFLVIGLCTATALRKRAAKNKEVNQQDRGGGLVEPGDADWSKRQWPMVKKALMDSVCWSKASKWNENPSASRKEQPTPLLANGGGEVGWPSHNSVSPVWQRPILMGEKCELPRFSGLILYDERGKPLDQYDHPDNIVTDIQEQPTIRTTLRDLL